MMHLHFVLISAIVMGYWFAAAEHSSVFSKVKTQSCGQVVLKRCWCLSENPCKPDDPLDKEFIPIVEKKNVLTEEQIRDSIDPSSPTVLSLPNRKFEHIDDNAFDNFADAKSLNLSINRLSDLPEFIFSKLTNLEHLSLTQNGINRTRNVFAGLNNLKTLDLSDNPLTKVLETSSFCGVTKSCDILIRNVSGIKKISTNVFDCGSSSTARNFTKRWSNDEKSKSKSIYVRSAPYDWDDLSTRHSTLIYRAEICIQDNIVHRLDHFNVEDGPKSNCTAVEYKYKTLFLRNMRITEFEDDWYQLLDREKVPSDLSAIDFTGNDIRVAGEVGKVLPTYITWLTLNNNKIERLETGSFVHDQIFSLQLDNNLIAEIEEHAFKMPALYQLSLRENRLKSTKFAKTLPPSVVSLDLQNNEITGISDGSLSDLKKLRYLSLQGNRLTTINTRALSGATSLNQIILSNNEITTLEPGALKDLNFFQIILDRNNLSYIEKGVFTEVPRLGQITLSRNKFTKIEADIFDTPGLEILDFEDNLITEIEKGSMKKLKKLKQLNLSKNPITRLENGALFGLTKSKKNYVYVHHTPIEVIQGGLFDDV